MECAKAAKWGLSKVDQTAVWLAGLMVYNLVALSVGNWAASKADLTEYPWVAKWVVLKVGMLD